MANSDVLWLTTYANNPYRPIIASISDNTAKLQITYNNSRRCPSDRAT